MALGTVKVKNVYTQASIWVQDLGWPWNPPYFPLGQATYLPYNTVVTLFRGENVEVSLAGGQLKKLIDIGWVVIVP